jgi:hypothetical protein
MSPDSFDRGLLTFDGNLCAVLSPRIAYGDENPLHKELPLNFAVGLSTCRCVSSQQERRLNAIE